MILPSYSVLFCYQPPYFCSKQLTYLVWTTNSAKLIWWWCLWPSSWCHWSASTHLMMMSLTIIMMPLINIRHHQQMCFALFVVQTRYVKSFARIVVHIVNHKSTDVFWIWTTNQQMCFALFMVHIVRGRIQVANVVVFNSNSRDFKKKLPNLYWVGFK